MARRKGPKPPAEKKKKAVNVKLIQYKHAGQILGPHRLMEKVVREHHDRLVENKTKIALAWQLDSKEDADGHVKVGSVRKQSDLERELQDYDFVISLNKGIWDGSDADKQEAILDDLLTRCEVSNDKNGNPKIDEEGRVVYRVRKPDVVGFSEVYGRRGMYTSEIERAFEALRRADVSKSRYPLLEQGEKNARVQALADGSGDGDGGAAKEIVDHATGRKASKGGGRKVPRKPGLGKRKPK